MASNILVQGQGNKHQVYILDLSASVALPHIKITVQELTKRQNEDIKALEAALRFCQRFPLTRPFVLLKCLFWAGYRPNPHGLPGHTTPLVPTKAYMLAGTILKSQPSHLSDQAACTFEILQREQVRIRDCGPPMITFTDLLVQNFFLHRKISLILNGWLLLTFGRSATKQSPQPSPTQLSEFLSARPSTETTKQAARLRKECLHYSRHRFRYHVASTMASSEARWA